MDERNHDLFGHPVIGGHGIGKLGIGGEQRRQDCQKYKEQRGGDTGDSKDAMAICTVRYTN